MYEIGGSGHVEDGVVYRGPGNGEVVGINLALIIYKCEILDPVWPVGKCMVRWRGRVGERVSKRKGIVWLSALRVEARIGV